MTSDEIRAKKWERPRDVFVEIAAQIAQLNERLMLSRLVGETKQQRKQQHNPRQQASLARNNGANLFHVSSWGISNVTADMLQSFYPDDDQPGIEELEKGQQTTGKLGTKTGVVVTRKR